MLLLFLGTTQACCKFDRVFKQPLLPGSLTSPLKMYHPKNTSSFPTIIFQGRAVKLPGGVSLVKLIIYGCSLKKVVPPNHPLKIGFSIINHPFWGTIIWGNPHIIALRFPPTSLMNFLLYILGVDVCGVLQLEWWTGPKILWMVFLDLDEINMISRLRVGILNVDLCCDVKVVTVPKFWACSTCDEQFWWNKWLLHGL